MVTKLLFLGDICTDGYHLCDIEKFKKTKLHAFLENYNGYIIGNLEAPIIENKLFDNKNKISLLNDPLLFELFNHCDLFVLANNHIFDQGMKGLSETLTFLDNHGKKYFGVGVDLKLAREPFIMNIKGKSIYLLAYNCYSTNSEYTAKASSAGPAPLIFEYVQEDVKQAKKAGADYIFILPHWGIENEFYPTIEQVGFARRIIDLGVDGIIGTHPHVIQAFERYKNKPIYYSLGNYLFNNFKINEKEIYFQNKFNKEGLLVELLLYKKSIKVREYYIKLDGNSIPELHDVNNIHTKIDFINDNFRTKTSSLIHQKLKPNLSISLKFNGKSMQLVYDDVPLTKNLSIRYEKIISLTKRFLVKNLRRVLSN